MASECGACVSYTDTHYYVLWQCKNSALHYAASEGHSHTVATLVRNGARLDTKNSSGQTPLEMAQHLDPLFGNNGKTLALLSGEGSRNASYKDTIKSLAKNDWVARESPLPQHQHEKKKLNLRPRKKSMHEEVIPITGFSAEDIERQELHRMQSSLINFQGVKKKNPRYPACAFESEDVLAHLMEENPHKRLDEIRAESGFLYEGKTPEGGYILDLKMGHLGYMECTHHTLGTNPHKGKNHCQKRAYKDYSHGKFSQTAFCRGHGGGH